MKSFVRLFFALLTGVSLHAQTTDLGTPKSWNELSVLESPQVHTFEGVDLEAIRAEDQVNDALKDRPWRFGFSYKADLTLDDGNWTTLQNGGRIWRTEIHCPEALSVNLILENLFIPSGASLFLFDKNKTNFVGAYTARNNREDGVLGTELILGDRLVLEYFEPANVVGQGHFEIKNVIHGYRSLEIVQNALMEDLNNSADCMYDVECSVGQPWMEQSRSVAFIVLNGNEVCTGALINNTCEDGRPLILTANHCLSGNVSSWAFRFNWKAAPGTEVCATTDLNVDPGPPYDQTANGATVLVNGTEADHLLLEVDNMTLTDVTNWNLKFAGWNANDNIDVLGGAVLHHPAGDIMKVSTTNDALYHSNIGQADVWWVDSYEFGSTQGGSSGAPFFDQEGRIVGQLYGGQANCSGTGTNGLFDYYGRLGVGWNYGLKEYLAPNGCGNALVMDAWDPSEPNVFDDVSVQYIIRPDSKICGDTIFPQVIIRNAGDNDLTSCELFLSIDAGMPFNYSWTGLLTPNSADTIAFPAIPVSSGLHTLEVTANEPNGVNDNDPSNNDRTTSFTVTSNTTDVYVNIATDCYGYENAWAIFDGATELYSGGNQTVPPGGNQSASANDPGSYGNLSLIQEKVCLSGGCYDFVMYDDWGDGLEGTVTGSCAVDGDYAITNSFGDTVASMQQVDFGDSETVNFCIDHISAIGESANNSIQVYPNPVQHTLFIASEDAVQKVIVRDVSGRVLIDQNVTHNTLDLSTFSAGEYLVEVVSETYTKVFNITKF